MIRDALEPFASGQIGRYDDEFEVRAFGDNLTLWGTPVVLIETGPWPVERAGPGARAAELRRASCRRSTRSRPATSTGADPKRYESLPMNESKLLLRPGENATVMTGTGFRRSPPTSASSPTAACR